MTDADTAQSTKPCSFSQKPSIGRIVLYCPDYAEGAPQVWYPAIITHVWGDNCVNLNVQNDGTHPLPSDELMPTSVCLPARGQVAGPCWQWPPRV